MNKEKAIDIIKNSLLSKDDTNALVEKIELIRDDDPDIESKLISVLDLIDYCMTEL